MPMSGLCAPERCGLACCGRPGVHHHAPGGGETAGGLCRASEFYFNLNYNSKLCGSFS